MKTPNTKIHCIITVHVSMFVECIGCASHGVLREYLTLGCNGHQTQSLPPIGLL